MSLSTDSPAFHGLAGEIALANDPLTEADPVAVLANILCMFGNVVGHRPHTTVEHTAHAMNLFFALVGDTSKSPKGQSMSAPRNIFQKVDSDWAENRIVSGLSSGEGLIYAVRDPRERVGRVPADEGITDKRLLIDEEEFAQALKAMSREGNTLSPIIRTAWDSGNLQVLTKKDPNKATGAHISILAHITANELTRLLTKTEQGNGFANRFLWLHVQRSKKIPIPTGLPDNDVDKFVAELKEAKTHAESVNEINLSRGAIEFWTQIYSELSEGKEGLIGAITSRAEAQVRRLAALYAFLNCQDVISVRQLKAALALWQYAERSVERIFGQQQEDSRLQLYRNALQQRQMMTRTQVFELFERTFPARRLIG